MVRVTSSASGKHVREMYTFYIEKLGYAGVNLFFLFLLQNIDCGYSLDRLAVLSKNQKNVTKIPVEIFISTTKKFSVYCMGVFS